MVHHQAKFLSRTRSLVMLRSKRLFSLVLTSSRSLVWLIQLLLKKVSLQFLMRWWTKSCFKTIFSLSTWPQSKLKELELNQTWLSVIMTKRNSRVRCTGTMSSLNTCMVSNLMILNSMENLLVFAQLEKNAWSLSILELLLCQFQSGHLKTSLKMVSQHQTT